MRRASRVKSMIIVHTIKGGNVLKYFNNKYLVILKYFKTKGEDCARVMRTYYIYIGGEYEV